VFDSKCQLNCQLQHEFGPEDSPIVFWTKGSEVHLTGSWIWEEDSSTESDDSACEDTDDQHASASTENVASKPTTSKKNKIDQTISEEMKPTKKSKKNSKGESKSQAEGEVEVELAVVCRPPTDITLDAKPWKVKPQNDEGVLVPSPKLRGLSSGVSVCDFIVGRGVEPKLGSVVHLTYEGYFPSGELFDANLKRKKPFKFRKGVGQVVRGLDLGLEGLRVGGAREVYIPFELG
jgi:FKBP-type peptidyl-prolyl cis-trans isomerase